MKQEFRVTYQREGGKKQYKSFQRYPNFLRFIRTLILDSREDLKPIIYLDFQRRFVGEWLPLDIPDIPRKASP